LHRETQHTVVGLTSVEKPMEKLSPVAELTSNEGGSTTVTMAGAPVRRTDAPPNPIKLVDKGTWVPACAPSSTVVRSILATSVTPSALPSTRESVLSVYLPGPHPGSRSSIRNETPRHAPAVCEMMSNAEGTAERDRMLSKTATAGRVVSDMLGVDEIVALCV
jgi:hypothetical protein